MNKKNQHLKTRVNIDKGEQVTKINMQYFEIVSPLEREIINDNDFINIVYGELGSQGELSIHNPSNFQE